MVYETIADAQHRASAIGAASVQVEQRFSAILIARIWLLRTNPIELLAKMLQSAARYAQAHLPGESGSHPPAHRFGHVDTDAATAEALWVKAPGLASPRQGEEACGEKAVSSVRCVSSQHTTHRFLGQEYPVTSTASRGEILGWEMVHDTPA